jgi:hypothetical protein
MYTHVTPCGTILLGDLTVSEEVKKFFTFFGTRGFINSFT